MPCTCFPSSARSTRSSLRPARLPACLRAQNEHYPYVHIQERSCVCIQTLTPAPFKTLTHLCLPHLVASTNRFTSAFSSGLSCKNFRHSISTGADDKSAIATPGHATHAFASHSPMTHDILRTDPFLERPESYTRVVTRAHSFPAILGERQGGDGGGVCEHGVCALTCHQKVSTPSYVAAYVRHEGTAESHSLQHAHKEESESRPTYRYSHRKTAQIDPHAH